MEALLVNAVFMAACYLLFSPLYEKNDDFGMSCLLYGVKGTETDHLVFINVVLGRMLQALMNISPSVGWYFYVQVFLCFISFVVLDCLFREADETLYLIVMIPFFLIFQKDCYLKVQFTKTASLLTLSGGLLLRGAVREGRHLPADLLAAALLLLGGMVRWEAFLMIGGMLVPLGLACLIEGFRG